MPEHEMARTTMVTKNTAVKAYPLRITFYHRFHPCQDAHKAVGRYDALFHLFGRIAHQVVKTQRNEEVSHCYGSFDKLVPTFVKR